MEKYRFDPDELLKDELVLTKVDVGRRQLNTAIRLFVNDEDFVSTHTVIAAAHGVIRDLAIQRGIKKSIKDSPLISCESRAKYLKAVHLPQNFFKHANKDSEVKIAFRYNLTPFYIFDAIVLYVALRETLTDEMKIFIMWFQLRFSDLFCLQATEKYFSQIRKSTSDPETFRALARVMLSKKDVHKTN